MNWFLIWLFLHITGAVIAFGPIFVFPIIGSLAQKNPMHAPFAFRVSESIERGLVVPLALFQFVSGVGLLISVHIDLLKTPYLIVGIVLYLTAMTIALSISVPTTAKLVHMTEHMPAPAPGAMAAGPPPELLALTKRLQVAGMVLTALFLVIIFLMIIKPGGIVNGPLFG